MNELRNARKEELSLQYHQLNAQAKKEVFEFLNSLPELVGMGIQIKPEHGCRGLCHDFSWKAWNWENDGRYPFETRISLVPNVEKTFGAEIELTLDAEGLSMNYGTCGIQNLSTDEGFIQKNLLIGIITLNQAKISDYLLNQRTLLKLDEILKEHFKIREEEMNEEAEARKKAQEEEEAKKLADKKAKAAARRKARKEAQKAANL